MIGSRILKSAQEPLRAMIGDRLSLVGVVVLLSIIGMALFAPFLSTHEPLAVNEREEGSLLARSVEGERTRWVQLPALGERTLNAADYRDGVGLAVGRDGAAWRYRDGEWSELEAPLAATLIDVAIGPDGAALAVGVGGAVALLDDAAAGSDWQALEAPVTVALTGVTWLDGATALLVGVDETILRLDVASGEFEALESPLGRGMRLNSVAVDADGSAWMVGERGLTLRLDPDDDSLSLERLPTNRDLNHIHLAESGHGLIVGERGTLLARSAVGERWQSQDSPDSRAMRAGWVTDEGHAFAVGRSGIVFERETDEWRLVPSEEERHLRALMVTGEDYFALGSDRFVNRLAPPSGEHWFGTDHLGRDLYSQNVHGSRIALLVGFIGAALVVLIGANVGLVAGYFRGRTETVLMRTVDVMYGIPFEPFALILVLLFEPSLLIVILAVSLLTWRTVARLIRSQVLSLRERPFVKAARVAGASDLRIMYLHIFPNVMPLVFLELAIIVGVSIIAEATLSFLGLGPPQSISWGGILHNARLSGAWRDAWWWNLPPGLFIMITVLSVFFISRSLELVANPRLRARR
ncbi:ABC transporter permease subunit [Halomonas daqingensis]|uniref:ABC transporter permease subunit n=1 Tax=Billgrantia desiderata TaxID=52021 RepID=A0AAW4YY31_9GAMM|nr:ABC transporter permease subunit [Halomonas desiderata]MCE8010029.1 ABC transporter permease subunit [Halomonas desiderata]MCE8030961.1 ABC transporter permease subunit [Halomonas desiderata]MCE8053466.1 ABC transporter permease subunit [Halomonas desiderata]NIC36680.1 ABC transporter permease subunit [Halomonas desiderata]SEF68483.1 ABC-type dipeptide/oligopeptide/nickel transport system, permease component [Halomonas desiderata]